MKTFPPTPLAVKPTPKPPATASATVVHVQANQNDLTQWPWPQIIVYTALLAFLIFGGPGARLIALIRLVYRKTIGALGEWVVFLPPALAADESLALIKASDATATLHVALFVAGAGVLSILSTGGLAMFSGSVPLLVTLAIVLISAGAIVDLVCLLRDYRYATQPESLSIVAVRKSRLVKVASLCFIAGVFLLLVNAWWAQSHQSQQPPGFHATPGAFGRTP
jgi:hypothetical protein